MVWLESYIFLQPQAEDATMRAELKKKIKDKRQFLNARGNGCERAQCGWICDGYPQALRALALNFREGRKGRKDRLKFERNPFFLY